MFLILIFVVILWLLVKSLTYDNQANDIEVKKETVIEYLPYYKKNYLMTGAEHNFFKVLNSIVDNKYYIIPQVGLSKIVGINGSDRYNYTYLNKIDRKSLDFVLFDKDSFSPIVIIELDDSSHEREDRKERDSFVDKIAQKIGLKIVHIKTSYNYDLEMLKKDIF
ncbi:MAG: DUF2726 domain-containing protein [bacterium]